MTIGRGWITVIVAASIFVSCAESTQWPTFEAERVTFRYPSGTLVAGVAPEFWAALLDGVQEVKALGAPPLLADAVDLPLGPTGGDLIDFRTVEKSVDCPRGGSARFQRLEDDVLADRLTVEFKACRYNVVVGAVAFPQELAGQVWLEVEESGFTLLHYEGDIYVDGHRRSTLMNMVWGGEDILLNAAGQGGDVIAGVDLPGTGLSGTVTVTATNGVFECQVDGGTVYCVDLAGLKSFEAALQPGNNGGSNE